MKPLENLHQVAEKKTFLHCDLTGIGYNQQYSASSLAY